jgi:hypothetical protein
MNAVDHILIAVSDIEAAADRIRARWGLNTLLPGGSPFPGVANAIIPLGPPAYIELVTATDPSATAEAERIARAAETGDRLFTWVVEPEDFGATAARIRIASDGDPDAGWQTLGGVRPDRPFFIRYSKDRASRVPGWQTRYDEIAHPARPGGFTFLEVSGEEATVRDWVGEIDVPLRFVGGEPRLAGVGIASPAGEIVLRDLTSGK